MTDPAITLKPSQPTPNLQLKPAIYIKPGQDPACHCNMLQYKVDGTANCAQAYT